MSATTFKLLKIVKEFTPTSNRADEFVETLEEALKEAVNEKVESKVENLATKEDLSKLETKLADTKADIIKWMFIFWVGQMATILGILFVFFKK